MSAHKFVLGATTEDVFWDLQISRSNKIDEQLQ